jgi:hypothetical protein
LAIESPRFFPIALYVWAMLYCPCLLLKLLPVACRTI